jgi:hypothetical protein
LLKYCIVLPRNLGTNEVKIYKGGEMFLDDDNLNNIMGLEESVDNFIQEIANSFIKLEIVQYCFANPDKIIKLQELSKNLNRGLDQIQPELTELAEKGFLQKSLRGKEPSYIYYFTKVPSSAQENNVIMKKFFEMYQTREGRLRVIYKILKYGKPISNN